MKYIYLRLRLWPLSLKLQKQVKTITTRHRGKIPTTTKYSWLCFEILVEKDI